MPDATLVVEPQRWLIGKLNVIRGEALDVVTNLQARLAKCTDIEEGRHLSKQKKTWAEQLYLIEKLLCELDIIKDSDCAHKALFKELSKISEDGEQLELALAKIKMRRDRKRDLAVDLTKTPSVEETTVEDDPEKRYSTEWDWE